MELTKRKINDYISRQRLRWADTTLKTEKHRLLSNLEYVQQAGCAADLYESLQKKYSPYTIKTLFIRLNSLFKEIDSCDEVGEFMKTHSRLFKYAYQKEELAVDFDEALQRIQSIKDNKIKKHCLFLLYSGLRISESYKVQEDNAGGYYVVGKGGKPRKVYGGIDYMQKNPPNKQLVQRALKRIGLKAHSLRKLFATRLCERGAQPKDLCQVLGWSSIETAMSYLQAKDEDTIKEMLK